MGVKVGVSVGGIEVAVANLIDVGSGVGCVPHAASQQVIAINTIFAKEFL